MAETELKNCPHPVLERSNDDYWCTACGFTVIFGNRRAEPAPLASWRVGSKVPLNVYDGGGNPVCQCHTSEQAALIVAAVNRHIVSAPQPDVLEVLKP